MDAQTGIWMITIYTLAYAASIPIMGKLADRFGRKYVYLCSILLFGGGSLLCGLKNTDFFDLAASVTSTKVYPFLLLFILLIPVFMLIESRATDPVMNLGYFKNRNLLVSFTRFAAFFTDGNPGNFTTQIKILML